MILPVTTCVSTNNMVNRNAYHKRNFMNNVSFGNTKNQALSQIDNVARQIDLKALMQYSDSLISNLEALKTREAALRKRAERILDIAQKQICDILTEYGFNPGVFNPNSIDSKQSQISNFFKLTNKYGGSAERVKRGDIFNSYFEKFAQVSLGSEPNEVYYNTYNTLTLKSKKYPNTQLDICCTPNRHWRDTSDYERELYLLGIKSFKSDLFEAVDKNLDEYNKVFNRLTFKNHEFEFTGTFSITSDKNNPFWFVFAGGNRDFSLIDKKNNVRFEYNYYNKLEKIILPDNTTYDLRKRTITQKFPDKNMVVDYSLSENFERVNAITLKEMKQK